MANTTIKSIAAKIARGSMLAMTAVELMVELADATTWLVAAGEVANTVVVSKIVLPELIAPELIDAS
jgi:hypothetical protein